MQQWKDRLIAAVLAIASFFAGSWKDTVDRKMAQVEQHETAIAVLTELARQSKETNTQMALALDRFSKAVEAHDK